MQKERADHFQAVDVVSGPQLALGFRAERDPASSIINDNWGRTVVRRLAKIGEGKRPIARIDIRETDALRSTVESIFNEIPAHHWTYTPSFQPIDAAAANVLQESLRWWGSRCSLSLETP